MPLNTILVNQGDSETDVPGEGSSIVEVSTNLLLGRTDGWSSEGVNVSVPSAPSSSSSMEQGSQYGCDLVASNKGWGIPLGSGLKGGGLNSLNNGTSGWGAPPTNPNVSGWGTPPVNPPPPSSSTSPPSAINNNLQSGSNQWASASNASPNRNASQNTNGQPNLSGSQMINNPNGNATGQPPSSASSSASSSSMQVQLQQNPSTTGGIIPNPAPTSSSWAQAAGKSLQSSGGPTGLSQSNNMTPVVQPTTNTSSVTSKQIEQLNSMREALFSQDGWGGNVNQDSNWDIPGSPEPTHKDLGGGQMSAPPGNPAWKTNVNNGTDLWEANLRNGGAPPPPAPTAQKAPWGHTPSNNIGGTWGEEDDGSGDGSNVWSGNPQGGGGVGGPVGGPQGQGSSNSGVGVGGGSTNWGMNGPGQPQRDSREQNVGGGSVGGGWNTSTNGNDWSGSRPDTGMNPNQAPRGPPGPIGGMGGMGMVESNHRSTSGSWDDGVGGGRAPQRNMDQSQGIMWSKGGQQNIPPSVVQPPQQQQQQQGWGGPSGKQQGWDDVSPPTQRRPVPNYDDGTSVWGGGAPTHQQQQQMPTRIRMPNKMEDAPPVGWGGNRNGGWSGPDGPQDTGFNASRGAGVGVGVGVGGGGWEDNAKSIGSWGGGDSQMQQQQQQQQQQQGSWGGKPKTPTNASGWGDEAVVDTSNWGAPPKNSGSVNTGGRYCNGSPNHNASNSKDPVYWNASTNSNSNRMYKSEYGGYKKEDIDLALRATSMNLSDAIDSLDGRGGPPLGGPIDPSLSLWGGSGASGQMTQQRRPPLDHDFELGGLGAGPGGPMMGGPMMGGGPQRYGVPNPRGMNNVGVGGANPSLGGSINPNLLQRILTQQQQPNNPQQGRVQPNNAANAQRIPPFNSSVSVLVQQIQAAVQAGYLSNQILQHPLPPQSLVLLNSLLHQIKTFQLITRAQQQMRDPNSPAALQLSVQITKTKQTIQNLHNQIASQQAHHAKQQQQHFPGGGGGGGHSGHLGGGDPNNDFFKSQQNLGDGRSNLIDPLGSAFGSDFLKDGPGGGSSHQQQQQQQQPQQPQSRLSQWTKLPSMDKDDGNEFSRAPGGPQSNNGGNGSGGLMKNNSNLILGPSDNTWSTSVGSRGGDGWPTDHGNNGGSGGGSGSSGSEDQMKQNPSSDSWPTDLVPEFEPGKPWKGTQILKSVDDDPTLTPGSVVRSPLSLATIKDAAEIFAKNSSTSVVSTLQNESLPLSLSSSSTWSYTPTSAGGSTNPMAKLNQTRELWDYGGGNNGGSRPPPGLQPKKQGPTPTSGGNICWLLLRNLTPQIDGSTLRTLCVQHGPLQKFHLGLNHGIALVRYNSREEAAKAQSALNNCVLGNTTILAETAGDNDVQGLLHSLNAAAAQQQNNSGFSSAPQSRDDNPWGLRDNSPLWSNNPNPWGSSGMEAPDRATPSSLNSLLPDGLLGGESA